MVINMFYLKVESLIQTQKLQKKDKMDSFNEQSANGLVLPGKGARHKPTPSNSGSPERVSFRGGASTQPLDGRREGRTSQTSAGFKKADFELALRNTEKKSNRFHRGEEMGMLTDVQKFRVYGPGVSLFFQFQKNMLYSFFFMSLISLIPIVYNVLSGTVMSSGTSLAYYIASTSIGNFSSSDSSYSPTSKYLNVIPDMVSMLVFIVYYFYWLHKGEVISESIRNQVKLKSYFTIELMEFSLNATTEDVHNFMAQFGGVAEVAPVRNYNETIALSKKIYDLELELKELELKKILQHTQVYEGEIAFAKELIDETYKELVLYEDDTKEEVIRYYVMFYSIEERQGALKELGEHAKKWYDCCLGEKTPQRFLLCGEKVEVRACHHEPAEIIWGNQHVNWSTRWLRVLVQYLLLLAGIAAGFLVISFLNILVPSTVSSVDTSAYSALTIQSESNLTIVQSWCVTNHVTVVQSGASSAIYSYCWEYISQYYLKIVITIGIALGIVLIKFILKQFVIFLAAFKRYKTHTEQSKDMIQNLFFVYLSTTVLVTLLLQADILTISFKDLISYFISNDYLESNVNRMVDYSDFVSEWYVEIGYQIIFNAIVLVFHPTFSMPVFYCLMERFSHCKAAGQEIQAKMEKTMDPPEFELESDYAEILTIIFMSLAFSGGMPVITVLCFLSLFLRYYYEKYYFIQYCRVPKMFDEALDTQVTSLIPYAIIVHFCLSIWMFGTSQIFVYDRIAALSDLTANSNSTVLTSIGFLLQRLFGTWYYSAFFLVFLLVWLFKQILFNFFVKVFVSTGVSHKVIPIKVEPGQFSSGVGFGNFVSSKTLCDSYKLQNNPDYLQVLEIMRKKRKFIVKVKNFDKSS